MIYLMFITSIILDSIIDKMKRKLTLFLFMLSVSVPAQLQAQTQWRVMSHTNTDSGLQTRVATIENEEGYRLEIYRDANDVIRSRFNIRNNYDLIAAKQCPTFQVDERELRNRSINDAPCISQPRWAEYIMGYISDNKVLSLPLHNLMNGEVIYFRFLLKNRNYAETAFSLSGSKTILFSALGHDLTIETH